MAGVVAIFILHKNSNARAMKLEGGRGTVIESSKYSFLGFGVILQEKRRNKDRS
jgi:hypothetical protein